MRRKPMTFSEYRQEAELRAKIKYVGSMKLRHVTYPKYYRDIALACSHRFEIWHTSVRTIEVYCRDCGMFVTLSREEFPVPDWWDEI